MITDRYIVRAHGPLWIFLSCVQLAGFFDNTSKGRADSATEATTRTDPCIILATSANNTEGSGSGLPQAQVTQSERRKGVV